LKGGDAAANDYMHRGFPTSQAINRLPVGSGTNAQSVAMLKHQNLLDPSYSASSSIMQNPIAQFLPKSFGNDKYSFAL
jgi:hypothetical protein